MWTIPDDDFTLLLERVADVSRLHYRQPQALRLLLEDGGAVDVRRIMHRLNCSRETATDTMRAMMHAGFVQKDGQKWRFAFRGARRI